MRIGIDLDNTIASYDKVFRKAALDMGLVPEAFAGGKREVRDAIRHRADGELNWQRLQGQVYGKYMSKADMIEGVDGFLKACRDRGKTVLVVSHKTEFGHQDPARINLREAARVWMAAHGFFAADGFAIAPANVYFETTRAEKIARIAALRCTCFIDDLEEVLRDDGFPTGVRRILLGRAAAGAAAPVEQFPSWDSIGEALFDA